MTTGPSPAAPAPRHAIRRLRHDTRRRSITVSGVSAITPRMLRITFTSPDLADFSSAAHDDHIKLFVPALDGG